MGEVYLAVDTTELERAVAIKVLPAEVASDPKRMQRFVQEARTVSALNHPNILTIYEFGQEGAARFIATEYVDGLTLRELLRAQRMKLQEVLDIAMQIAAALDAAHEAHVVHRDIKPDNIMLRRRDHIVKVLDFGLAKPVDKILASGSKADSEAGTRLRVNTAPGVVMGTVSYMSPEQSQGARYVDHRTDIWSLGAVLYEMIAGRVPFEGKDVHRQIIAIQEEDPPPLSRFMPGVPERLEDFVTKALAKDPDDRYQTAKDLLIDLRNLKRKLEVGAEIDRTVPPEMRVGASRSSGESVATVNGPTATTAQTSSAHAASSAEYIISEIKRHKRGAILILAALVVVMAGIAFGLYIIIGQNRSPTKLSGPAPRVVPFTSFPGIEDQASFSPDGNQIAFAWDGEKGDNVDIYVKMIDAETPLRLTTSPEADVSPAWSPDGRYIAFIRSSETGSGIFMIPPLGGIERKLVWPILTAPYQVPGNYPGFTALSSGLSWSPDSKSLAFSAHEKPDEPNTIFLVSVESLEKHKLMSTPGSSFWGDQNPVFSPDGKTLAFTRGTGTSANDLYVVPADGGEPKRLTLDNLRVYSLAWTGDGREIVFSSNREGGISLWRISVSGGKPERLAAGGENGSSPAISRQGNRLAYTQAFSDFDIWRLELSSSPGKVPNKFISSTRDEFYPQFSPDGKRIAFESDRSGSVQIWVCDSEGLNCTQLTSFGTHSGSPRWSPDNQRIAFDSIKDGNKDIYVVSVEGGLPRRLTTEPSDEVRPSWSRDGQWIYFGSNRTEDWQVWKAPAEGGAAVQVTKQGGREAFESPDGKFVYYTKGSGLTSIWRVPAEGGEEIRILDQVPQGSWALVDQGIYYFVNLITTPRQAIEFFSFATGRLTPIATFEKQISQGLTVSPNGRWLLYAQLDRRSGSDIMLVENFR